MIIVLNIESCLRELVEKGIAESVYDLLSKIQKEIEEEYEKIKKTLLGKLNSLNIQLTLRKYGEELED